MFNFEFLGLNVKVKETFECFHTEIIRKLSFLGIQNKEKTLSLHKNDSTLLGLIAVGNIKFTWKMDCNDLARIKNHIKRAICSPKWVHLGKIEIPLILLSAPLFYYLLLMMMNECQ